MTIVYKIDGVGIDIDADNFEAPFGDASSHARAQLT
jgi:hypothetical protein